MRIVNETKSELVSAKAGAARSFFSRAMGLMFSSPRDLILVSPKEDIKASSIHMMLMRYPIDVVWLDAEMRVVDVQKGIKAFNPLKPGTWRIYRPQKPAKYVIELGAGKVGKTGLGDVLSFLDT